MYAVKRQTLATDQPPARPPDTRPPDTSCCLPEEDAEAPAETQSLAKAKGARDKQIQLRSFVTLRLTISLLYHFSPHEYNDT